MNALVTRAAQTGLLVLLTFPGAGCATSPLTPAEKMMWSTYMIASPQGVATCFIVNRKDASAPDGIRPILVTSAHVLSVAPDGPFYLAYRSRRPGQSPQVDILEIDPPDRTHHLFVLHPRHDVAAMEIRLPPELLHKVTLPSFLEEDAIAPEGGEPHIGDDISVLGFPSVYPGTRGAFPVLRSGRIASYSAGPPSEREKFMVNTNVYSGDSGGPVFRSSFRGKPQLVGILTERIGEKEGSVPLAVAINASVIAETLKMATEPPGQEKNAELPFSGPREVQSVRLIGPLESFREFFRSKRRAGFPIPTARSHPDRE